jgi:NAD(P)-dependent dehydrogenase (short-subunit alcohol dehydrogenase family)
MGALEGKVALVTGGASGIGAATVRRFAHEGARVLAVDVQDERGAALAEELGAAVRYQRADVSREPDVAAAVDRAVAAFGRLDVCFNNAGVGGVSGPIAEIPADEFDVSVGVLLRGVFLGIKHAARVMLPQRAGSIVNTASVAGLQAGFGPHVYSACKAAVIQLTRTTAMELGESGVRVNCICPGGIATPLLARAAAEDLSALAGGAVGELPAAEELVKAFLSRAQPIQRAGLPDDIAEAALFLGSDAASFVNGHALVVDGGLTGGRLWSQTPPGMRARRPPESP